MMSPSAGGEHAQADLIRAAIERGITDLDTAPLYDFGGSERVVGRAIRGIRERVRVFSKVGLRWSDSPDAHGEVFFSTPDRVVRRDGRPESVRREVEESLERLGIEYLDLVQIHQRDSNVPLDETLGALADLLRGGRVRAIGVSNFSLADLREAKRCLSPLPLASTQERYNLVHREIESDRLSFCRENEVALLAYSPLAQGLLAGRLLGGRRFDDLDFRARVPEASGRNLEAIHAAMARSLIPLAQELQATAGEVALAWLLAEPGVSSAVVGASSLDQIESHRRASQLRLPTPSARSLRSSFESVRIAPDLGLPFGVRARRFASRVRRRLSRRSRGE